MDFASELTALASVVAIDITLAGDNAVVIGIAAAGLAPEQRRKAILWGITAAACLRILFSVFAVQLLGVIGLLFAGGLLLLWVSWKLWRELRDACHDDEATTEDASPQPKKFSEAVKQIVLADVSMSLDNVLAVAGAAREHVWIMVAGLALSVALTGAAAETVARVLKRWHWIAYVGLGIIVIVALRMIWDGAQPLLVLAGNI
ncbi:Integral membrane protein TerC family [Paramagnetospirillum magnetotacticum MS-1]|uniref:Integral membrane protein TerC family n=1 Tax=Paramagnetospirillum magnetotacticum MS-1 TaxID=272627 RepID=A0A0C2YJI4_PARME|nr:YjbE family putative metal transport protein [Paramagnetospirillum magnetotacticum]KIL99939.1 Integral membrane protein TerC family [Paramagnetospirillum magnetotacticum MS-1]